MSHRLRCAVYTRKSTEEGLDQAFNSLAAQRESCCAYIASQAGEGWLALKTAYDDGGFSGGSMQRPGLCRLLADVAAGKIDIVVVYKIDRLTRSLLDFARIVEVFDAKSVSFVSVTQSFNTTTSMGRLTLNVLLSFAQFEREVTGERIRDKIAASKKKGLWMGGVVPLGYDVRDRKLVVNTAEAQTIRTLFDLYLEHANTRIVKQHADKLGLLTKRRTRHYGHRQGGEPFQRGHINKVLTNPIYIGEIVHKGVRHPGEHEPIIARTTWEAAQAQLKRNAVARRHQSNANCPSLLAGLLFDERGERLSPSHASKGGRRYRYYTSRSEHPRWRLPAQAIEQVVIEGLQGLLNDRYRMADGLGTGTKTASSLQDLLLRAARLGKQLSEVDPVQQRAFLLELVSRSVLAAELIKVTLRADALRARLGLPEDTRETAERRTEMTFEIPVAFKRRGVETRLIIAGGSGASRSPDPRLLTLLAQAHQWFAELHSGSGGSVRTLAMRHNADPGDVSRILPLALLAPDIVEAILDGRQPTELTAARLKRVRELPLSWAKQRRKLGFL
jgi:DNA invertase Pin-like site-specific DNA recombinase